MILGFFMIYLFLGFGVIKVLVNYFVMICSYIYWYLFY